MDCELFLAKEIQVAAAERKRERQRERGRKWGREGQR